MRLLVIGGGITGLAAAWEASRGADGPVEVLLVEAGARFGGKIHTEVVDRLLIEHGPDSFVSYRPAAQQLATEVGLGEDIISTAGTRKVYLRTRGRLEPIPDGMGMVLPTRLGPFVTTKVLSPLDKARAGLDLFQPRRLRPGQDVAIGTFLRQRLGSGVVQRFADPMVGGIYGASVDELSLDAVLPSLRADETTHRSLILASLAAGRARKASGRGPGSPFRTLRNGLGSLVDALVERLTAAGAELRLNTSVERVSPTSGGGIEAALSDGSTESATAVVFAGGAGSSARLLGGAAPQAAAALGAVPLTSSTVVNLAYPAEAFAEPVDSHGWLEADPLTVSGVTISSTKWAGRAPGDLVLIRAFLPGRRNPSSVDDFLLDDVQHYLADVLGIEDEPVATRLTRWDGVMPKYTLGHLDRVATAETGLRQLPAWRIAGSALHGVGVPECIADGRRQARLALGRE